MVRNDEAGQLESIKQLSRVAVDLRGRRVRISGHEVPPGLIPPSTSRTAPVDLDMDGLGNEQGVLVDVRDPLRAKPLPELSCLGKQMMASPAARWQDKGWGLGIEMPVEAEGEEGFPIPGPDLARSPPAARRWRGAREHRPAPTPKGQSDLTRRDVLAAEETTHVLVFFPAHQDEAVLVRTALIPRGELLGGYILFVQCGAMTRACREQQSPHEPASS